MICIKKNNPRGAGLNTGIAPNTFIRVNNHIASIIGDGTLGAGFFTFFTEGTVSGRHMNSVFVVFMGDPDSCLFRVKYFFMDCRTGKLA